MKFTVSAHQLRREVIHIQAIPNYLLLLLVDIFFVERVVNVWNSCHLQYTEYSLLF